MCLEIIFLIYVYKVDLALNNLQWLIYHKNKTNQIIYEVHTIGFQTFFRMGI